MTLDLQDPANRRASCDQCRQKKLKCDGGYPSCGRCSSISESCKYSSRLPMGRPKKRKTPPEAEVDDSSAASRTSPSTLGRSMDSDTGSDRARRASFDPCQQTSEDAPLDMLSLGPETNVDPKLLAFENESSQESCACLASLYLSLEEIRKADDLPFTSRLSVLRHLTASAAGVIQCQICPTKFLWAMQNAQLLNTLLISLAEGYKKIVNYVEEETRRAEEAHEAKSLSITEGQPQSDGSLGLSLSLDPQDWKSIANKAIKSDLFGTTYSTSLPFVAMLDLMEQRQTTWHSGHSHVPPGIGGRLPHQPHDKEPHCISVVKHTKDMISHLLEDV